MQTIDIVLIKPGSQKQIYGQLSDFQLTGIEPPLWGAILAAYLRELGYRVELFDAEAENYSYEQTAQFTIGLKPLIAAVLVSGSNPSASTMNMTGAGQIIRSINQFDPSIKTLLAGLHPSALPEMTMQTEVVDFVCQGEGFYTLPQLIDAVKQNNTDFNIPGLWFRDNGKTISNHPAALMENLDKLPQPAWDMLPMEKYRAHNWHCFDNIANRQPYAILYTSLGCPFRCTFCCINALFGKNTIRYRGIDAVIAELDFLVNTYGVKNIKIIDEMFAMNEKRVIELCDRIIERKYDLNIWAYARVNTVTEKMFEKMKTAGINWLAYGFESGSKRVIADITKGYRPEMVEKVVKMTYNFDIHICGNYIFGLPEDDLESMKETLQMMLDINAEWANIYSAMAYPGSKLYELAVENNWPLPKTWQDYSQYGYETLPLPTKYLTGGQVLAFRDRAFDIYYKNPEYLLMIEKKFGQKTKQHILEMSSKKLKRKYASALED